MLIVAALYMMEHLAGLQGVFLAVPITIFTVKQVIFAARTAACPTAPACGDGGGSGGGRRRAVVQ